MDNLLGRMSKKAGLSTHFTSHCIRATSLTILKTADLENSRVKSVTGHKSDASIESYHERLTIQQQVQSSEIVSNFGAPVKASQANAPLRVTAQSRSPLRALQQNQSHDKIRLINQQSYVGLERGPEVFTGYFSKLHFQFLWHGQSA